MANIHSSGKEPVARWNQRVLKTSITNKLKEMDLQINPDELSAVMAEQKDDLLASCPDNVTMKDFVTEQITSQIVSRLVTQGSLTFSLPVPSQPAGISTETHYRQEFINMINSLSSRLLMDEIGSSSGCQQKLDEIKEISEEVWELMKPDLSRRQDIHPRFQQWMPKAREYIEVICALEDEDDRRGEIERIKRKREKLDAATSEDSKSGGDPVQKQDSRIQRTAKKNRRLNLDAPQSSQRTAVRAAAASSSTDSVRTQSLNTVPSGAQGFGAGPSLICREVMETPKSEQKIKLDRKMIDNQMEELFGTDDDGDEGVSPRQSQPAETIAVEEDIVVPDPPGFGMQVPDRIPLANEDSRAPTLKVLERDAKMDELAKLDSIMGP